MYHSFIKKQYVSQEGDHIDVKLYVVRDVVAKSFVNVVKISTLISPADMLTKVIPVSKFKQAVRLLKLLW